MTARVVTISAAFGAGGSVVGPQVADRLKLPFVDRLIPAAVAESLDMPLGRVLAHDEKPAGLISRIISKLGAASLPYGVTPVAGSDPVVDDEVFKDRTEQVIRELAEGQGGVVLGRAAAIVLSDYRSALHVRLDGDKEKRAQRVAERQAISIERARDLLVDNDAAREEYVKYFYKCDAHDARLYHLTIDSTVVPLDTCTDMIVSAAQAI